ncbi:MAG: hypothetical protein AB8I40_04420 [Anaerolineales bacterium]
MKALRFLGRQLLALITAVVSGLLAGQLLSRLPTVLFKLLGSSTVNQYQTWIQGVFWTVPFLVSLCVSLLISMIIRKRTPGRAGA